MSGSKDWNDLDAGGGRESTPRRSARPDLQEKMRKRFQNRNPEKRAESESDNTSPVDAAMGQEGAFKRVPQGAAGGSSHEDKGDRGETPGLDEPDANGNFIFHDGHNSSLSESGRARPFASRGQGHNSHVQMASKATGQDHFDKALNSVLGELSRDEQSQRRQKSQTDATAVFENNFDDLEAPQGLNIPAGGAVGALGGNRRSQDEKGKRPTRHSHVHGGEADDEDDEMIGLEPEQGKGRGPMQEMMRSVMGGGQNENERADPLAVLLGGRPGGNIHNDGLNELLRGGRGRGGNPLAALMGGLPRRNGGERNDNDDPFAALLGAAGRDPLAAMMGNDDADKKRQNAGNDFRTSIVSEARNLGLQNRHTEGGVGKDRRQEAKAEETSDGEHYEDATDDSMEGKKPVDRKQPKEDPVRAMIEEMTKGMKGSANPLGAFGAGAGRPGRGRGGMGQLGGLMGAGEQNKNSDPEAALVGGRDDGRSGLDPFTMRGASRDGGSGGSGIEGFAGLMGNRKQREEGDGESEAKLSGGGFGINPSASVMGVAGRDGGGGGGTQMGGLSGLLNGGAPRRGGSENLPDMCGGGGTAMNPLAAFMGRGGRGQGMSGNPLLVGSGGGRAGAGGSGGGDNPFAALMGGGGAGGNPLAGLQGNGGSRDGGGGLAGLAGMLGGGGAGGNPLAALMGGGGAGGNAGGEDGLGGLARLAAGMFGGGGAGGRGAGMGQMLQALPGMLSGGEGGPGDGSNPMASLMSSLMGGGRGKPGGDQEQLLRQMAGQAGVDGDDVNPATADENQIIQQLLAYEMMRAQNNRAPRAEQALHTIIIVDTSRSMDGEPLIEAGQFISQFMNGLEELQFEFNLQENVALVCVGGETQVVQHFTNDYSLIRRATDSLIAAGSSPLHLGLLLPVSLLSHGSDDNRGMGNVYQLGGHIASPRVIFISDGYPNPAEDVPGQYPRPDDQLLHALQSRCIDLAHTMTERTLGKIYSVPVGNSNLNFMEILADSTRGKVMQPKDAKHMSRCLLHHVLVSKLQEYSRGEPTRQEVAELLQQVTATAEEDDINGVFEVIREGEPDIAGRDQRVAQYLMQSMQGGGRGRGGGGDGGGGMQGLGEMAALMGQGQGQGHMPGLNPGMMGLAGRGGLGGGIPMLRSRRRPGGGRPVMGGDGEGSGGLSGFQNLLQMGGARGRGSGMDNMLRVDGGGGGGRSIGGGGGFESLMGMGGGGNAREALGRGRGFGSGKGGSNGMEAMMQMAGGGNGQGRGGFQEMMGGNRGQAGGEAMLGMGGGAGGIQPGFGIRSGDGQNEQKKDGLGQMQGSYSQIMLGMGDGGNSGDNKSQAGNDALQKMLGVGNEGEQNEQGKSVFSYLPGGSLAAMLGMEDNATGRQGSDTEKVRSSEQSEVLGNGDGGCHGGGAGQESMMGLGVGGSSGDPGQLLGMGAQDDGLGLLPGGSHQALFGMGEKHQDIKNSHSDRDKSPESQKNNIGASAAGTESSHKHDRKKIPATDGRAEQSREGNVEGAGNPPMGGLPGGEGGAGVFSNIPRRRNQRGNGIFNTVPPQSFGIDEDGNPRSVPLMGDPGEDDKEGDELMDKLASMLGIEDDPDGEGIFGADADNDIRNRGNGDDFLRGLPDMFGQRGGMAGGMPRNPNSQPPDFGGPPPNIGTYLQNLGRDSRAQNDGRLRDEDGDAVMGGLDDRNHSQIDAAFAGFGGAGGGNLPFFGGANRGQRASMFPQAQPMNGAPNNLQQLEQLLLNPQEGNQGMPSIEEMLGQLGIGGMGGMPGMDGQQPDRGHDSSWSQ